MSKINLIKARLAKLLIEVEMATIKTDKAVLEYDGELAEGVAVFVTDAETAERTPAADGEYVTEDNKVITVADGKVVSIVEKEEEPAEEPTEEPKEEVEAEEKPAEEEKPVEEEPVEEEPKEEEKDNIAELTQRVEVLEGLVKELVAAMEVLKSEMTEKLSMSAAKPAMEEFEQLGKNTKTGDSKLDKFLSRYGNK